MTPEQLDEIEAQINEFGEESGFILPLVKALREAWAKNDAAHGVVQMILEADALKPHAYEEWGEEESIYDACKRIVDEWRLP